MTGSKLTQVGKWQLCRGQETRGSCDERRSVQGEFDSKNFQQVLPARIKPTWRTGYQSRCPFTEQWKSHKSLGHLFSDTKKIVLSCWYLFQKLRKCLSNNYACVWYLQINTPPNAKNWMSTLDLSLWIQLTLITPADQEAGLMRARGLYLHTCTFMQLSPRGSYSPVKARYVLCQSASSCLRLNVV